MRAWGEPPDRRKPGTPGPADEESRVGAGNPDDARLRELAERGIDLTPVPPGQHRHGA